jgi:hypothetical protein
MESLIDIMIIVPVCLLFSNVFYTAFWSVFLKTIFNTASFAALQIHSCMLVLNPRLSSVVALALAVSHGNALITRLDLIHTRLNLIHTLLYFIHSSAKFHPLFD